VVFYHPVFLHQGVFGQIDIRIIFGQMLRSEKFNIVKLPHSDLVTLGICEPLNALAHLPKPKPDACGIRAEKNSDAVLFVFMPPALEPSIIRPLIVTVALPFIHLKFTHKIISAFE